MTKQYVRALTIAGSDSGGGAGIQADLKTFAALGCYGMSVMTALTAQNTQTVTAVLPVPTDFIRQQFQAILEDIGIDVIKIGMLHDEEVVKTVAELLRLCPEVPVVLDPVMIAKGGAKLLQPSAVAALQHTLFPSVTMITPNLPEAESLLGKKIATPADMKAAARQLSGGVIPAVLMKGGHLQDARCVDYLYVLKEDQMFCLTADRVDTRNTHGTGCTLSAAIAAGLGKGLTILEATKQAKSYITGAMQAGATYSLGGGHGPVHHLFQVWA